MNPFKDEEEFSKGVRDIIHDKIQAPNMMYLIQNKAYRLTTTDTKFFQIGNWCHEISHDVFNNTVDPRPFERI